VIVGPVPLSFPGGAATVTFETYEEDGELICGLLDLKGKFDRGAFIASVRRELKTIEELAREAGCVEMRLAGRDWSRVLTDYEPLPGGEPNRLRKRLTQ
jgi:hypothetical protein